MEWCAPSNKPSSPTLELNLPEQKETDKLCSHVPVILGKSHSGCRNIIYKQRVSILAPRS